MRPPIKPVHNILIAMPVATLNAIDSLRATESKSRVGTITMLCQEALAARGIVSGETTPAAPKKRKYNN
jgi:hypothetical protein